MSKSKSLFVMLFAVVLGAGVLGLMGFGLASAAPHQPAVTAKAMGCPPSAPSGAQCASISIAEYPDSMFSSVHGPNGGAHPDWVSYSSNNLHVKAHTWVTMTVYGYDGGGSLNNTFFGNVVGTAGGVATVYDPVTGKTTTESRVDPNSVGHTFTLRGIPGNTSPFYSGAPTQTNAQNLISVPIPANFYGTTNAAGYPTKPVKVTFSFMTGAKGVYEWNCEFPCGGTRLGQFGEAMSTYGYMSGTLTVD